MQKTNLIFHVRKITQFFENIQNRAELETRATNNASKQPYPTNKLASSMWRGEGIISGHSGGWGVEETVPDRILSRGRDESNECGSRRGGTT